MSEKEIEAIANKVAEKMKDQAPVCQVFSEAEIFWVKGFFDLCKRSRATAVATVIGFVVLAGLGLLALGIAEKLKHGG